MADFRCIASAGLSIARLISTCFVDDPPVITAPQPRAVLIRTEDLSPQGGQPSGIQNNTLSIMFYRVDVNTPTRAAWSAVGARDGRAHLPLDLHFLITAWAANAVEEYTILGRAMECLETTPILSGPLLDSSASWAPNETVQIVLGEITTEEVMRIFESLPHDYKLSVPYIARIVRLDSSVALPTPDVATVVQGIVPSPVP